MVPTPSEKQYWLCLMSFEVCQLSLATLTVAVDEEKLWPSLEMYVATTLIPASILNHRCEKAFKSRRAT